MKILFTLGARSEWGYIRPLIDLSLKQGHQCEIWACNMSVLSRFGSLIEEIEKDGYQIAGKFHTSVDGDNRVGMSKSLGLAVLSASDWLSNNKYDWIIISGDRVEQLGVTLAAAIQYLPIAHIQAGERSGNIDGVTRHAIARYAHLHFAANEDAKNRLIRSGEDEHRVHVTGAPQIDEIKISRIPNLGELMERRIISNEHFILAVLHGVTEESDSAAEKIQSLISILHEDETQIIWIGSNNDNDKLVIEHHIKQTLRTNDRFYSNLNRLDYLALLKHSNFIIGNSSSGILEAPSFGTPAINIGRRQDLRFRGQNVIDCSFEPRKLKESITLAKSKGFVDQSRQASNPYGDGESSQRILEILESTQVNPEFLIKQINY